MGNREITQVQLAVILLSTNIGVSMLAFPRYIAIHAETAAISATALGTLITLIGVIAVAYLGKLYSTKTFVGYSQEIVGGKIGKFFIILFIIFFLLLTSLQTREFGEVVVGSVLPNTPIIVPITMMAIVFMLASFQSTSVFAYIHFFYIGFTVAPILFILVATIGEIDWIHIQPIFGNETTLSGFFEGALLVSQIMINFFIISMIIPFMRKPEKAVKASVIGWMIASSIFVATMFFSLAVFGSTELENVMWPVLILGRLIRIPAEVFQRLDAVLLVAWMFAVFTTLYSIFYFTVRACVELFNGKSQRVISVVLFVLVVVIAMLPRNTFEVYELILLISRYGVYLIIGYPLLLLIVRKWRGSGQINESS